MSLRFQSNPATLTAGQPNPSVPFSLAADQTVSPGDYKVNVTGTSGSITQKLSFTVKVVQYLVVAQANLFNPSSLTVKLPTGIPGMNEVNQVTVYWLNLDSITRFDPEVHNVIISSLNVHSPDIPPGPTFGIYSYSFTTAGTYHYICVYHGSMDATITVTA